MKPLIQNGCTRKSKLKDILLLQKKVLRNICFKNRSYPFDELFERSRIINVYDLYVCEVLKNAFHSRRGKIDKSVKSFFTHKNSIFTLSVSTETFHVPPLVWKYIDSFEVSWNVLKYAVHSMRGKTDKRVKVFSLIKARFSH